MSVIQLPLTCDPGLEVCRRGEEAKLLGRLPGVVTPDRVTVVGYFTSRIVCVSTERPGSGAAKRIPQSRGHLGCFLLPGIPTKMASQGLSTITPTLGLSQSQVEALIVWGKG